jgi:DNA-binding CsgD family transcriptional regulator
VQQVHKGDGRDALGVDFVAHRLRITILAVHEGRSARRPSVVSRRFAHVLSKKVVATMAPAQGPSEAKNGLDPLVYRIHAWSDAGGDWSDVLALLRDRLDGRLVTLSTHHFASGHGEVICEDPASPAFRVAYAEYASRNPWFLSSVEYVAGRVVAGEDLLSNRDLVRTDFYRALLEPHGLLHCIAGVAMRSGALMHFLSVHRGPDQEPFGERDKATLGAVLAHVSLALGNRWRLRAQSDLLNVMMGVVDRYPHPCLLIDAGGRIVHANRNAAADAMPGVGLAVDAGALAAALPIDRPTLRQAVRDVIAAAGGGAADATRAVTLSVPGGKHPSVVSLHAAGRLFDALTGDVAELVLVTARNPSLTHDLETCSFVKQFGLSPAQARVGVMIVSGHSLMETARKLHVSDNTVRSHLKQIFQKTNTHGQMELVHLHAKICAPSD